MRATRLYSETAHHLANEWQSVAYCAVYLWGMVGSAATAHADQPAAEMTAAQASAAMTLPIGFRCDVVAAEPLVRQPVAMTIDERGRIWVAENYSYPHKRGPGKGTDRILIFEDTDGDVKADRITVFAEGLDMVTGLEVGHGGIWVGQAPELLFFPDANRDDRPDGPAQVVLDGWGFQDTHETLNSFIWGPDGWLYGCHGVFSQSHVGPPNTPNQNRVFMDGGIWRFHPVTRRFEVMAEGTSNPWGLDFDSRGEGFLTCCVIPHLFHVIHHGRYQRQAGQHPAPFTYGDIQTIANHRHWGGDTWDNDDLEKSDRVGGGHAHSGALLYAGGGWPSEYRGRLLMNNIHGARLNCDTLRRKGSGYEGNSAPDFCRTNDVRSQMIALRTGPDGQLYAIDWYDAVQCHQQANAVDRSNGRIYRISHGEAKPVRVNLMDWTDAQLAEAQSHDNDWYARTARRILHERATAQRLEPETADAIWSLARSLPSESNRLRCLWAAHLIGGTSQERLLELLATGTSTERSWAIRLLAEPLAGRSWHAAQDRRPVLPAAVMDRFIAYAISDPAAEVRLALAAEACGMLAEQRWDLVRALWQHGEDASDHQIPLMLWYATAPLGQTDAVRALEIVAVSKIAIVERFMIRVITSTGGPAGLEAVVAHLNRGQGPTDDATRLTELLGSMPTGAAAAPPGWQEVSRKFAQALDPKVRELSLRMDALFANTTAIDALRIVLFDRTADTTARRTALETLVSGKDPATLNTLPALLADPAIESAAITALATLDSPGSATAILENYAAFEASVKPVAIAALVSRKAWAAGLLDTIAAEKISRTDITAENIRGLRALNDPSLTKRIEQLFGIERKIAETRAKRITAVSKMLSSAPSDPPDSQRGRSVFIKICAQCHKMYGEGGVIGPELTGSNRRNQTYLLENIYDPSAVVGAGYVLQQILMTDGRVITGIIKAQTPDRITFETTTGLIVLERKEVENIETSTVSMMPDGLLDQLCEDEIRNLFAFLATSQQVPMTAQPAADPVSP